LPGLRRQGSGPTKPAGLARDQALDQRHPTAQTSLPVSSTAFRHRVVRSLSFAAFVALAVLPACKKAAPPGAASASSTVIAAAAASPATAAPSVELTGHRLAYDFLTNRVHGILYRGGRMVLDAGKVDFYKFVDGGWKGSWILGQKDGDRRVAFISGASASIVFPLDADGDGAAGKALADLQLSVVLRPLAPNQRLSIFANEKPVTTIEIGKERATYDVTVPAATLRLGENRIRLTFRNAGPIPGGKRSAAAIESIELGAARPAPATPAGSAREGRGLPEPTLVDVGGVKKQAISIPEASRLSFYVQLPAKAKLALSYGALGPGVTAQVRVVRDGAAPAVLFDGPAAQRFTDAAWDLSAMGEQAVRLDLVARGGGMAWGEPRLMVPGSVPAAAAKRTYEHIYVWMIDTLRADKVRIYNPKTNVITPNYDAFAADATRFLWHQVPGTWSLPSQASMLTGVYPHVHRATEHESKINPQLPIAPEVLKKAGFRTALFSSNGYVSAKWGFARGFDMDKNFIRENLPNGADNLWATAKKWVLASKDKPQFVYLAVIEPHVIYNPKKEFLKLYWDKPYGGPIKPVLTGIQLGKIKQGKLKVNDTDKAYLEALHNAEITQSDTAFGTFIADLKTAGLYDTSAVIVISDHGDEFWDHGDCGHAQGPHQELVHVPFMIHAPGLLPNGKAIATEVEAMDLAPTLLELAGVPIPDSMQGQSVLGVALDEVAHSPSTCMTQNGTMARGIKSGRYRLIHTGPGRIELYDEIEDPREQVDLESKRPIALRQMRNLLALQVGFENVWKKRLWGSPAKPNQAFYAANDH
jgi:arylsulfatase A-like enzyme